MLEIRQPRAGELGMMPSTHKETHFFAIFCCGFGAGMYYNE